MSKLVKTKVVTDLVMFVNANLYAPISFAQGSTPKFTLTLVIPKSDSEMIRKITSAYEETKKFNSQFLGAHFDKTESSVLQDGDLKVNDKCFKDAYYINTSSREQPGVVDTDLNPIIQSEEVYDGCFGRASITFYPYKVGTKSGIAVGLNNVMKMKDGERVSSPSICSDFL